MMYIFSFSSTLRRKVKNFFQFNSVQLLSHARLFVTPWTAERQASLSITNSRSLPKLMSIESVMPSNHLILCHPLLLLPSILPSMRVFSSESFLRIRWPKCCSFSFSISPPNECAGLISFRIDWIDLLAIQGTCKSLLQHRSSKASIRHTAFFIVQLSHPYTTTGKTIALTRQTFVGKVMSLLFNMLSRLVIALLPRSKCLLISWLQSPSAMILEPKKIVSHCFHCFPIYLPWGDGTRWHDLSFLNVESRQINKYFFKKVSAGATVIYRFDWDWRICFQLRRLAIWCCCSSSPSRLCHRLLEYPYSMVTNFPQSMQFGRESMSGELS